MAIEQTAETGHDITLATHLVKMDSRVVFDRYTPRDGIHEYYSLDDPELDQIIEEQLEQSLAGFVDIGECAMMELLHEMETGEEIQ